MGLFSRKKKSDGLFKRIYSTVVTGAGNLITSGIEQITGKTYARTTPEEFRATTTGKILGTAATITAIPLVVLKIPAIIKALTPKTIIGKGVGLVVGGGAVISPTIRQTLIGTPEFLFEKGQEIGELVEELPEEKKRDPGTVLGLIAGAVIGAGTAKVIEKVKEGKGLIDEVTPLLPMEKEKELGKEGEIPILPETAVITTGKTPSKRRRAKITPSVMQKVSIKIINQPKASISKRYINQMCLR